MKSLDAHQSQLITPCAHLRHAVGVGIKLLAQEALKVLFVLSACSSDASDDAQTSTKLPMQCRFVYVWAGTTSAAFCVC